MADNPSRRDGKAIPIRGQQEPPFQRDEVDYHAKRRFDRSTPIQSATFAQCGGKTLVSSTDPPWQRFSAMMTQADEIRLNHLEAEIELGLKFARMSTTEGDRDFVSADRSKQAAVRASTIVHRFMALISESPAKHGLKQKLSELDKIISSLSP